MLFVGLVLLIWVLLLVVIMHLESLLVGIIHSTTRIHSPDTVQRLGAIKRRFVQALFREAIFFFLIQPLLFKLELLLQQHTLLQERFDFFLSLQVELIDRIHPVSSAAVDLWRVFHQFARFAWHALLHVQLEVMVIVGSHLLILLVGHASHVLMMSVGAKMHLVLFPFPVLLQNFLLAYLRMQLLHGGRHMRKCHDSHAFYLVLDLKCSRVVSVKHLRIFQSGKKLVDPGGKLLGACVTHRLALQTRLSRDLVPTSVDLYALAALILLVLVFTDARTPAIAT
mmetsp:Transcript_36119/g.53042  ORF Transcript_36119/g.53042 Transcript_36119/m.53042 type:complete len:282 (-) Transcript_36119:51-896(-)